MMLSPWKPKSNSTGSGFTVRVPLRVVTVVIVPVTSLPFSSRIVYEVMLFSLLPASVWLPDTTALTL